MDWRKSSRSFANGNCVEIACADGVILIRDTKNRDHGPVLRFTAAEWARFTRGLPR